MTRPSPPASALERRFAVRPHVGVVTHLEGLEPEAVVTRLGALLADAGLGAEATVEEVRGRELLNLTATVSCGDGMELWLVVSGQPGVGSKVEMRLYHTVEDSALADEYLAALSARVAPARKEP